MPIDVDRTIQSIYNAVKSGRLSEDRINESVNKILSSKIELDLINESLDFNKMSSIVGSKR